LPIDVLLPDIVAALRESGCVVLKAPPGAGKTTRVPRALLDAGLDRNGEILVCQPRRLPARMAAIRVAEELGEPVGKRIGYTVRFEDESSVSTRVRFVTEGILLRRLIDQPTLPGVALVILDEFHERHLDTDLALGMLFGLQQGARPDLGLCVMSATLEPEPIASYLGDAPILRSEGRTFPVEVSYHEDSERRTLEQQVSGAVRRVLQSAPAGDVLVFLPGASEIRRTAEALEGLAREQNLLLLPLHGDLPLAEQGRVVAPSRQRKVVLSTNVAETSVTIDGVVAVIDTGLARTAVHSPWTGLPTLKIAKISQASAEQRAGRAGRTRPGVAFRLYSRHDHGLRPGYDLPEVARLDLAGTVLTLASMGVAKPAEWRWFESPPDAAMVAAAHLLRRLNATDADGRITDTGRAMLRFPVHPRLARMLCEGERRGVTASASVLAAMLSERDIRKSARVSFSAGVRVADGADALEVLDRYQQVSDARFSPDKMRGLDLEPRAVDAVRRAARQFSDRAGRVSVPAPRNATARDEALGLCALAGFPDRVARRRGGKNTNDATTEVVLCGGGSARIGSTPSEDLLVALDVHEMQGGMGRSVAEVRLAVAIAPDHLLDLCSDGVVEENTLQWNSASLRVERVERLRYGLVVLDETRRPADVSPQTGAVLFEAVRGQATAPVGEEGDPLLSLQARLKVLSAAFAEETLPTLDGNAVEGMLREACSQCTSVAELNAVGPLALWLGVQPPRVRQLLEREAPERISLPGGRTVRVHYENDERPPWIESRLQDFFGLKVGPAICAGRVPLVLHLLAPNMRAVQVTRDLTGFWKQHYPPIRKELGRRYPRHSWPEDGATAVPPPPKPPHVRHPKR